MSNVEKTFFIIKPDGMEKHLFSEITSLIKEVGLEVSKLTLTYLDEDKLREHYSHIANKPFFSEVVSYMTRGKVLIGIFSGENAVEKWRGLLGATNPSKAEPGTIRQRYGNSEKMENVAHGSDSVESAQREINIWFGE